MPVTKPQVLERLRRIKGPDLQGNIVDLGLVYDMQVKETDAGKHRVDVKMTLTAQGCGMGASIAADARYRTNRDRVAHRAALVPAVAALLAARTTRDWLARLEAAQVPCGPINDLAQVFAEPQVRHRGLRLDLPHPTAGRAPGVRNPVRFSRTSLEYERAPPPLGALPAKVSTSCLSAARRPRSATWPTKSFPPGVRPKR